MPKSLMPTRRKQKGIGKTDKVAMNTKNTNEIAHYFGLKVKVICRLENSSLIRYQRR